MWIKVKKKIATGSSKVTATPSITFTKRSKYSSIEISGVTLSGPPIPSKKIRA
jgi:hypothetical protein